MILYHGSNTDVKVPDLSKSRPFKDFGAGFYLTPIYSHAQGRASQVFSIHGEGEPTVSTFEWDEGQAITMGLAIKRFDDYTEEWAEFVIANRSKEGHHPAHHYDIVIGPVADDGVTFQLRRYQRGYISIKELIMELKYAKGPTIQYFFGTERALTTLRRI